MAPTDPVAHEVRTGSVRMPYQQDERGRWRTPWGMRFVVGVALRILLLTTLVVLALELASWALTRSPWTAPNLVGLIEMVQHYYVTSVVTIWVVSRALRQRYDTPLAGIRPTGNRWVFCLGSGFLAGLLPCIGLHAAWNLCAHTVPSIQLAAGAHSGGATGVAPVSLGLTACL